LEERTPTTNVQVKMGAYNYQTSSRLIAPRRLIGRYLGCLLFIVLITLYFLQDVDKNTKEYRMYRENLRLGHTSVQNKHILLWTPFFESKTWYQGKEFLDKTVNPSSQNTFKS
jgi:hypothetical protein